MTELAGGRIAEQGPERSRFVFLREAHSRYDDGAGMMAAGAAPADGMCRVICMHDVPFPAVYPRSVSDFVETLSDLPISDLPRLLAKSAVELGGLRGKLWCVGSVSRIVARALRDVYGPDLASTSEPCGKELVIYARRADEIDWKSAWPISHGDDAPRLFLIADDTTRLAQELLALRERVRLADPACWTIWHSLWDACLQRGGARSLCEDALLCVLPDGEHCWFSSVQSACWNADEITGVLCRLADGQGWSFDVVDNSADEWLELFKEYGC